MSKSKYPTRLAQLSRRQALVLMGAAAVAGTLPAVAAANPAAWPGRQVRIVVPFGPGGLGDALGRLLAGKLSQELGTTVIVENKPGGGGALAMSTVARADDAHTLLLANAGMVVLPHLAPSTQHRLTDDFEAIGMVSAQPMALVVPTASPFKTVQDLIAAGKAGGSNFTAGTAGNGTLGHLSVELFSLQTGVPLTAVAYRGESAMMTDLVGRTVDLGFANVPIAIPLVKGGRARVLGVTGPVVAGEGADWPTFKSLGVENMEVESWGAMLVPKGFPSAARTRLSEALLKALASDDVKQKLAAMGAAPFPRPLAEAGRYMRSESERWGKLIRARNIRID